eukprot:s2026_g3.t1
MKQYWSKFKKAKDETMKSHVTPNAAMASVVAPGSAPAMVTPPPAMVVALPATERPVEPAVVTPPPDMVVALPATETPVEPAVVTPPPDMVVASPATEMPVEPAVVTPSPEVPSPDVIMSPPDLVVVSRDAAMPVEPAVVTPPHDMVVASPATVEPAVVTPSPEVPSPDVIMSPPDLVVVSRAAARPVEPAVVTPPHDMVVASPATERPVEPAVVTPSPEVPARDVVMSPTTMVAAPPATPPVVIAPPSTPATPVEHHVAPESTAAITAALTRATTVDLTGQVAPANADVQADAAAVKAAEVMSSDCGWRAVDKNIRSNTVGTRSAGDLDTRTAGQSPLEWQDRLDICERVGLGVQSQICCSLPKTFPLRTISLEALEGEPRVFWAYKNLRLPWSRNAKAAFSGHFPHNDAWGQPLGGNRQKRREIRQQELKKDLEKQIAQKIEAEQAQQEEDKRQKELEKKEKDRPLRAECRWDISDQYTNRPEKLERYYKAQKEKVEQWQAEMSSDDFFQDPMERARKKRLAQQKEALLNALAEEERRNEHPPLKRLEVEAKLQEQEDCLEQRPFMAPKAHDQPRPILQMIADSKAKAKPKASPSRGAWRREAQGVSKRYGLSAEHLRMLGF